MKNMSLQVKIILVLALTVSIATIILSFVFIRDIKKTALSVMFYKARAIGRMAENARVATGYLNTQNAFNTERLLKEAQQSLAGLTVGSEEFFSKLRQTVYYNTIPVVSAFNAALNGAEESHFQFKPTRFDARNPNYNPVTDIEKDLLRELQSSAAGEVKHVDNKANVFRYMRAVKLTKDCLICHGKVNDDPLRPDTDVDPIGFKKDGKAIGDMHGAFQIIIDLGPLDKQMNSAIIMAAVTTIIVILISCGLVVLYLRKTVFKPIETVSKQMFDGADQVSAASNQVSDASQTLSEGSVSQASSLEETSSALEEMSSQTRQNADNASLANDLVTKTRSEAQEGSKTMEGMIESMKAINTSSEEISKIIKVIEEIAFQTNLLALNAAVEAARAGEHGKGFAVVAEEVRNLAQRSAAAAKDTATLIEDAVKKAEDGSATANQAGAMLDGIVANVKKVADLVGEIATASNEQALGVEQTNNAVSEMDKITQANAATAEESAASAEELSAQSESLKEIVSHLNSIIYGTTGNGATRPPAKRPDLLLKPVASKKQKGEKTIPMEGDFDDF
ncbi:Methyl-accepting chemotaxis protein I (serine chemoreceptor protein) [hydrothermal vent metagenome]|uniref:Methyl-accepting chemotaxis protein I (Serine chemoreceptor protein) n=1 Tax=hydrothermal vent metagenome TaxID=652676 RepID=A0A3B1C9P9_9ZZZZ